MDHPPSSLSKTSIEVKEDVTTKEEQNVAFVEDTEEEKKLLRKIDMYLMPTIWVLYMFSYMDRSNIGNAKVAGMDIDLKLTDSQYFLAIILFLVGYLAAEVPSNMILSRTRPSIYIPTLMFFWGSIAACMAAIKTSSQLIGMRFLLGVFEAGFSPAVLFMISTWYRKHEQSKRYLIFLSAGIMSGAFGGIVAGAITARLDGKYGIEGWRWLFLVEGVTTVGVSFIAPWGLLDYPTTCKKLNAAERELAYKRLLADGIFNNGEGESNKRTHLEALYLSVSNWRVWLLAFAYMPVLGAFSLSYFYPALVKGLGYSAVHAQFMTAPLYVVALVIAIPTCYYADRIPGFRALIACFVLLIGAVFCGLATGIQQYTARYVFLCFINSAVWTTAPLALSFAATMLGPADPETRAVSLAIINIIGNSGQLWGAALFPAADRPIYLKGFATYAVLLAFGASLYVSAHFLLRRFPFKSGT